MKRFLKSTLRTLGYDLVRHTPPGQIDFSSVPDLTDEQRALITKVRPFTMTSIARMASLINAVDYVTKNRIPGDIAECGVWRGGSMMIIALTLLAHGDRSRSLYLYDTYEGMSEPTSEDKSHDGVSADAQLQSEAQGTGIWCYASIDDVRANLISTGYPADKIHFIKGKVEDTIPQALPSDLALLRLDTDWYESTRHELNHLYPLLSDKGILIIDDYGFWQGAKKAVDEYFSTIRQPIFLHRIDNTGRLLVKHSPR